MPNGGLSMFGAGLQLQPVTPGISNQGNFHASGTGIVDFVLSARGNKPGATWTAINSQIIGEGHTFNVGAGNNKLFNVTVIGTNCIIGAVGNNSITRDGVAIGYAASIGSYQCIAIGRAATAGNAFLTGLNAGHLAIGDASTETGDVNQNIVGTVAIGLQTTVLNALSNGQIVIGYGSNVTAGNRVTVIGPQVTVAGLNVVAIGNNPTPTTITDSNAVIIGDSSHVVVKIGSHDFTIAAAGKFVSTQTIDNTNSALMVQMLGTGVGTKTFQVAEYTPNKVIRIRAAGYYLSNGAQNIAISLSLGGAASLYGVTVPLSGAAAVYHPWTLDVEMCQRNLGTFTGYAKFEWEDAAGVLHRVLDPSNITGNSFDNTTPWDIQFSSTWALADPLNHFICQSFTMETMG